MRYTIREEKKGGEENEDIEGEARRMEEKQGQGGQEKSATRETKKEHPSKIAK